MDPVKNLYAGIIVIAVVMSLLFAAIAVFKTEGIKYGYAVPHTENTK